MGGGLWCNSLQLPSTPDPVNFVLLFRSSFGISIRIMFGLFVFLFDLKVQFSN